MILLPVLTLALMFQTQQSPSTNGETMNIPLPKDFVMGSAGVASFELDWPQAPVPHWLVELHEDGTGRYDKLALGAKASAETRQQIVISTATQERLRAGYKAVMSGECETRTKHLAQTGTKRIAYTMAGSDAWTACTFNYSDDKGLMDALSAFEAIATTMEFGERLARTHRFDRLGLDGEIASLEAEADAGRAIELQNIAPVLQSIVDDDRVIERARRKAARLLQTAPVPPPSAR